MNGIYSTQNSYWECLFKPDIESELGFYDMRFRIKDSDLLSSPWYYYNNSIQVLNNYPILQNISFTKNIIKLDEEVCIWVNCSDVEDPTRSLTIELEYKTPKDNSWNFTLIFSQEFYIDRWRFDLKLPLDAQYGHYDFRVRVIDLDTASSQWTLYKNILLAINNAPEILDVKFSKNVIYRTDSIDISIYTADYETPDNLLVLDSQYKLGPDVYWLDLSNEYSSYDKCWKIKLTTTTNFKIGDYDLRLKIKDPGGKSSGWVYLNNSFKVLNNIPIVENIQANQIAYRGEEPKISVAGFDIEDPRNSLNVELEWKDINDTIWNDYFDEEPSYGSNHWVFTFRIPSNSPLTKFDFRARIEDNDNDYCTWFYSDELLNIVNKPPNIIDIAFSNRSIYRTKDLNIQIEATDLETKPSNLEYCGQYRTAETEPWLELPGYFENGLWDADFNTDIRSAIGFHDLRFKFLDHEGGTTHWNYLNNSFEVLNHQPIISKELGDFNVGYDKADLDLLYFGLDVETSQRDLVWNIDYSTVDFDLINYIVLDNAITTLSVTPEKNVKGSDRITLILSDGDGGVFEKSDFVVNVDTYTGPIDKIYQVSISVFPESIEIHEGTNAEICLIIENYGNVKNKIELIFEPAIFNENVIFENNEITLYPGDRKTVKVYITAPQIDNDKTFGITFIVKNDNVFSETNLTMKIKPESKMVIPTETKAEDNGQLFLGLIISVIILIVIATVFIFLFFKGRSKNRKILEKQRTQGNGNARS
jgi:hypothetical protein